MDNLFFWKSWPSPQKQIYQIFILLLAASLIYYLVGYFWSSKLVIQWETISQIKAVPLVLEHFSFGGIPLGISADFYAITQVFEGSDLQLSTWPAHLLLISIALSLVLGLSICTDLSRFWFLVSQIIFIFILVGFKLEQLLLFDRTDKLALILAFVLYLPAGYYFHITKSVGLLPRILWYFLITLIFGAVIYFFSGVSTPFLYLVSYGITVPIAITVIFILFTAHEIIYGFLYLITRSNTPQSTNSFIHFFALSIIYLVNVLLLYLKNSRRIDWDFYYLDAFWIVIATGLIGIWGLKQRRELYRNIVNFEPQAAMGYLGLAIVSFSTIGYFFATANDSTVEAFEDAIVFGQLSVGFVFLIYILFNFRSVLIENLKVYKVVYKPQKMPFFSMRIGGLIGVLGLFLLANQYPLDQAINGYYNGIGDLHRADGKDFLAREYYKMAAIYASTNHRSNYAIAGMALKERKNSEALYYFKQSLLKQPTPYAYVNTANLYQAQGSFFQALFTLKQGLNDFPNNGHIQNNLAMLYAQTAILDSAHYFLRLNASKRSVASVTKTNQLALMMRSAQPVPLDSLFQNLSSPKPEEISNMLLYASKSQYTPVVSYQPPQDSILNPLEFSWWYNHTLNQRPRDSSHLAFLNRTAQVAENGYYRTDLLFAKAITQYYSGDVAAAFEQMNNLQFSNNGKAGYYNHIMGLWCLQQNTPRLAQEYFQSSMEGQYIPSIWLQAITLLSLGDSVQARRLWDSYQQAETRESQLPYDQLRLLFQHDSLALEASDERKLLKLQFSADPPLSATLKALLSLKDPKVVDRALYWWLSQTNNEAEIKMNQQLEGLIAGSTQEVQDLWALLKIYGDRSWSDLDESLKNRTQRSGVQFFWLLLVQAKQAEELGQTDRVIEYYRQLVKNPFFSPGILAAARYYMGEEDNVSAYQTLLNSIEINRYNSQLIQEYARQCVRMNLDTYGRVAIERLGPLINDQQMRQFLAELNQISAASPTEEDDWDL